MPYMVSYVQEVEIQLSIVKQSSTQNPPAGKSSVLLHLDSGGVTLQHIPDPVVIQCSIDKLLQADAGYSHTDSRVCQKANVSTYNCQLSY